jgi:alcohol dehydrogenase class IV
MKQGFPIPQRLREVGLPKEKIDFAAAEVGKMAITTPRPASADDVRAILAAAY